MEKVKMTGIMDDITRLTVLLIALSVSGKSKADITCEAGSFVLRQEASVSCYFSRNVKDRKYHVLVLRFPLQTSANMSEETVLKCSGLDRDKPKCTVARGYEFNNEITDTLTVTIPYASARVAGQYMCQIVPLDGLMTTVCNLTIDEAFQVSSILETKPGTLPTNITLDSGEGIQIHTVVLSVVSGVAILALAIIGLWLLAKWLKSKRQRAAATDKLPESRPLKRSRRSRVEEPNALAKRGSDSSKSSFDTYATCRSGLSGVWNLLTDFPKEDAKNRLLLIGKSGSGKNLICNAIVSSQLVHVKKKSEAADIYRCISKDDKTMQILNTPDLDHSLLTQDQMQEEVSKWQASIQPFPTAVLLFVRKYDPELRNTYTLIQKSFGDKTPQQTFVVVSSVSDSNDTHGECPSAENIESEDVGKNGFHRFVFHVEADNMEEETTRLLKFLDEVLAREEVLENVTSV